MGEFPQWVFLPHTFAQPTNNQIDKLSILKATNRGTNGLIVEVPAHIATAGVQGAVQGIIGVVIGSTPEQSGDSNLVESTIVIAKPTWESRKTKVVSSRACRIPS